MDKHVSAVAALFIALGVLGVLLALIILVAAVALGPMADGDDEEASRIFFILFPAVAVSFLLIAAANIVGGIALLQRRPWARLLVLILSFLSLFHDSDRDRLWHLCDLGAPEGRHRTTSCGRGRPMNSGGLRFRGAKIDVVLNWFEELKRLVPTER